MVEFKVGDIVKDKEERYNEIDERWRGAIYKIVNTFKGNSHDLQIEVIKMNKENTNEIFYIGRKAYDKSENLEKVFTGGQIEW